MAHEKHQAVRQRYAFCCGYCGVSEIESGGELNVDHYRPTSHGGAEDDDNLVYCCPRCNLNKSGFWPSTDDLRLQRRVLHPQQDNFAEHLQFNARTGEINALTETARFHIALLHLNRPALVANRLQKHLAALLLETQKALEGENAHLRATIRAQEEYLNHLRSLLGIDTD